MEIADRLRQFALLDHFTDPHIGLLARCTSRVRYAEGTFVLREGERSQGAYLIDVGEVQVERNTPYGKYSLASLGAGELFGETSFIDGNARSSDAVTLAHSVVFPLEPLALEAAVGQDPRFNLSLYWMFWKSLSAKLRRTNDRLASFFSSTNERPPESDRRHAPTGSFSVGLDAKRSLFQEQRLSPMEINFLTTLSKEKRLAPGDTIFHEGEEGDRMYVVLEGRVMISKQISGAGEEALAFLERGDYFGEMALIDQQPRSADAKAGDEGAVVLGISREVMEGILDIQKVSSFRLLRLLCDLVAKRLREVDDKLVGWHIFSAGAGEPLDLPG